MPFKKTHTATNIQFDQNDLACIKIYFRRYFLLRGHLINQLANHIPRKIKVKYPIYAEQRYANYVCWMPRM